MNVFLKDLKLHLRLPTAAPLLSGILTALAFPNPWGTGLDWPAGPLVFVALVPVFWLHERYPELWRPIHGWVFGWAHFGISLFWIARMPALGIWGPPAWLALTLYVSVFSAGFFWVYHRLRQWGSPSWFAAPLLWILFEFARNYALGGFPWGDPGYALHRFPFFLRLASVAGIWGVTALVIWINLALVMLGGKLFPNLVPAEREKPAGGIWRPIFLAMMLAGALGMMVSGLSGARAAGTQVPRLTVAALQGNIDQNQTWDQAYIRSTLNTFRILGERAVSQGAGLLVWPESSFPGIFAWDKLQTAEAQGWSARWGVAQMVGSDTLYFLKDGSYQIHNSLILVDRNGQVAGQTSKIHLVPLGEFVPFKRFLPAAIQKLVARYGAGDFTPGDQRRLLHEPATDSVRWGTLICFESLFTQYGLELVRKGSQALIVVTNDAWFGRTAAPATHAIFAAFRAAETDRYLVRAAATGISCIFGPDGRLLGSVPLQESGLVSARVRPRDTRTWYVRLGPWVVILAFLLLAAELLILKKRRRKSGADE